MPFCDVQGTISIVSIAKVRRKESVKLLNLLDMFNDLENLTVPSTAGFQRNLFQG